MRIYTNSAGKLLKNYEYSQFLKESTNFNKIYISKKVSSVNNGLDEIESNSMMLKYNVPEHINIKALRKNILDIFSKEKIKVLCGYKGEGTNNQTLYGFRYFYCASLAASEWGFNYVFLVGIREKYFSSSCAW